MVYDEILSSNQIKSRIANAAVKNLRNITSIKFYSIYLQFWNDYYNETLSFSRRNS